MLKRKEPAPILRQYSTSRFLLGRATGACWIIASPSSAYPTSSATDTARATGTADDGTGTAAWTAPVPVPLVGVSDCTCTTGFGIFGGFGSLSLDGSDGSMTGKIGVE